MLEDAFRVLAGKKMGEGRKRSIYKNGFFIGAGIFAGIGLNDLFRISGSNLNKENIPQLKETKLDEMVQYGIVVSIIALSIVTGKYTKEVVPMSLGALTGITWANLSERGGNPISLLPFD